MSRCAEMFNLEDKKLKAFYIYACVNIYTCIYIQNLKENKEL